MTNGLDNEFSILNNVILRIIWPFFPIIVEMCVEFFTVQSLGFLFPNKSILIIALILPITYLPDYHNRIDNRVYLRIAMYCEIPSLGLFICYLFEKDVLQLWGGFVVLIATIIGFILLDYRYSR